jgi:hypothetical protein
VGLTARVAALATRHAHALVVEAPGSWGTRVAVERAVLSRGWRLADSPADADLLVVCGSPGPRLADAVEVVWHQLPGPRVRVDVPDADPGDVVRRLDRASEALQDTDRHRHDARHRPAGPDLLTTDGDGNGDHGDHDEHGGHGDHDDHDEHGGHGDHGAMAPEGIALAGGGEDRDGLEMDVLEVRLGPVLRHWPAGLVLQCSLQGDVIVAAEATLLEEPVPGTGPVGAAEWLDAVAALLALAGWADAAAEARRARDAALDNPGRAPGPGRLRRRVRRARLLRWSLRGVRHVDEAEARRRGLPTGATGETWDRLLAMLDAADPDHPSPARPAADHRADRTLSLEHLGGLVTGLDLATARLVVASLGPVRLRADDEHEVAHA